MSKKIRKTKTGEGYAIREGVLYCEGVEQCAVMSEKFAEIIEDGYVTAIRVESLSSAWYETNWVSFDTSYRTDVNVQMTLRSEIRRGKKCWYAYRKYGGVLQKRYVGQSERVNEVKLRDVARTMG